MEVPRQCVSDVIREAREVVEAGQVAMVPLVDAKQAEEVRGSRVRCGAALALPERGVQVVASADRSALARVKGLDQRLQVDEPSCQLQVRVGQGAASVGFCDYLGGA